MGVYQRPGQSWSDLPSQSSPITAAWLTAVDDALTDAVGAGGRVPQLEAGKLDRAGDSMLGPLFLPGDPTFDLVAATKAYVDTQTLTRFARSGGIIAGVATVNATATVNPSGLPAGYQASNAPTGVVVASSYPSDDVVGGTDGTGRILLYSYQRANAYSFGEVMRIFNMRKDSKQMIAWYAPTSGFDGNRDPVAGTSWKPVTWIGSHWESNGHTGNHKHWEIEIPDSAGALQGRLEVLFGKQSDETIGLDKTSILTNLCDFVVRCKGVSTVDGTDMYQALRLSAAAGYEKAMEFANDVDGVVKRWKIRTTSETESGAGAGANFQVVRYDDTGVLAGQPIIVRRSDGQVTIGGQSGTEAGLYISATLGVGATPSITPITVQRATNGTVVQATQTTAGATSSSYTSIAPTTAKALQAQVSGDTSARYSVDQTGKTEWGTGSATRDTNLYRKGAGQLGTDGSVFLANQASPPATPTAGGVLFVQAGALKYIGSSGTVTTLAPA